MDRKPGGSLQGGISEGSQAPGWHCQPSAHPQLPLPLRLNHCTSRPKQNSMVWPSRWLWMVALGLWDAPEHGLLKPLWPPEGQATLG